MSWRQTRSRSTRTSTSRTVTQPNAEGSSHDKEGIAIGPEHEEGGDGGGWRERHIQPTASGSGLRPRPKHRRGFTLNDLPRSLARVYDELRGEKHLGNHEDLVVVDPEEGSESPFGTTATREKLQRSATERGTRTTTPMSMSAARLFDRARDAASSTGMHWQSPTPRPQKQTQRLSMDHAHAPERRYATINIDVAPPLPLPPPPFDDRNAFQTSTPLRETTNPRRVGNPDAELERKLSECMKEKMDLVESLNVAEEKLVVVSRKNEELETRVERLSEELEAMRGQLREAEDRRRKTARSLQEVATELNGMKRFADKTDIYSDSDIVGMIDTLNAEIMQTSASMADSLVEELPRGNLKEMSPSEMEVVDVDVRKFNRRALGSALIRYFERGGDGRAINIDPMAVQLGLQFCLVETAYIVVESWRPGNWKGEDLLFEIYTSLRKTEIQPVFGRWRSLTRAQMNYKENQPKVYSYFHCRVRDMLSLAGWPMSMHDTNHQEFLNRFSSKIERIATLSLQLHRAISEDMTSGELRMKMIYPEERFNRASIDEAFRSDELNDVDDVDEGASGTTDLGLVRTVGTETRVLKKPRIVLKSALDALLSDDVALS